MCAKKSSKKTVVTKQTTKKKISPTVSSRQTKTTAVSREMIFNKENYIWMAAGAALVALGMIMMLGGGMDDPNTWDPNVIYSTRITVVGPILILAGLIVEIYAIFK